MSTVMTNTCFNSLQHSRYYKIITKTPHNIQWRVLIIFNALYCITTIVYAYLLQFFTAALYASYAFLYSAFVVSIFPMIVTAVFISHLPNALLT